jgi:hypothetical protein
MDAVLRCKVSLLTLLCVCPQVYRAPVYRSGLLPPFECRVTKKWQAQLQKDSLKSSLRRSCGLQLPGAEACEGWVPMGANPPPAAAGAEHQDVGLSRPYVMLLASCGAGCVVVPVVLTLLSLLLLCSYPTVCTAYLGFMVVAGLVPLAKRGPWATRFARDMCNSAYEWIQLRIICNEAKFNLKAPYVIGAISAVAAPSAHGLS